ncbi:hypothetical protein HQ520_18265 [bacterium]|nr:hypothetical protein [bacterium]
MSTGSHGAEAPVDLPPKTVAELVDHVISELESLGLVEPAKREATGKKIRQLQMRESDWISLAEAAVRREAENDQAPSN